MCVYIHKAMKKNTVCIYSIICRVYITLRIGQNANKAINKNWQWKQLN